MITLEVEETAFTHHRRLLARTESSLGGHSAKKYADVIMIIFGPDFAVLIGIIGTTSFYPAYTSLIPSRRKPED